MSTTVRDYLHKKQSQLGTRHSVASESMIQTELPIPTLPNREYRDSLAMSSYSQSAFVGELASEQIRAHTPFGDEEHD